MKKVCAPVIALGSLVFAGCAGSSAGSRLSPATVSLHGAPPACAGALADRFRLARDPYDVPTRDEWSRARRKLSEVREKLGRSTPHTRRLSLKLREPFTGRLMEARGAVALAPPSALRMILLGPGGTTALDLWVKGDRYRFAIPAIDLLRRGDTKSPASRAQNRGLPVDFLKWWLLRPAAGTLLWHERTERADHFVLRDGSAIINLCVADGGALLARRTTWEPGASEDRRIADEETVIAASPGCGPVRYTQARTGLEIAVTCEGEETEREPNPRAFEDPDAPDGDDR